MTFTKEMMREIYQAVVNQDAEFVSLFAQAAIESAADAACDMWADGGCDGIPDESYVRNFAYDYTSDMLNDFVTSLEEAINASKFELCLQLRSNVMFE